MKIKKIKLQDEYIYPATIAAAIKDANFLKESGSPMTQGEINTSLSENKVDKIEGKGLSTNDYTDADKTKLDNLIWVGTQSEYDALSSKSDYTIYLIEEEQYVDLGLTSGTLWAKCNIGAEKETDYGLFFQWGDTVGYDESTASAHSTWSTCPGNGGASSLDTSAITTWNTANLTNNVLNTSADAAYVHTNGKAKMPTEAQFDELINETNNEWTTIDGVAGIKFTNKTDSSKYIFIPAAGYFDEGSRFKEGSYGIVWAGNTGTSSFIYCASKFEFDSSGPFTYYESYNYACCVRGVKNT